jgi:hypothetical protein
MTIPCTVGPSRLARLILLFTAAGAGCDSASEVGPDVADVASGPDLAEVAPESLRGNRYCEVLLAYARSGAIEAEVWGTQGLNDCPEAAWASVDAAAVRDAFEATVAVLNGPRHWLIDRASAETPSGSTRMFGELEMRQLATLSLAPGTVSSMPYVERTVRRNSEFEFRAGSEVYELLAPDGSVYVMQSWARSVDAALSESDLPGLGARLDLPDGWQYRARTLDAALVVTTPGEATVVQDALQNTYSRHVDGG